MQDNLDQWRYRPFEEAFKRIMKVMTEEDNPSHSNINLNTKENKITKQENKK